MTKYEWKIFNLGITKQLCFIFNLKKKLTKHLYDNNKIQISIQQKIMY